jgi:hypothetical protein
VSASQNHIIMDPGEDVNTPTTRLLTLLNVSALKSRKRTRDEDPPVHEKLNKRKTVKLADDISISLDPGPSILHDKTNISAENTIGTNEESDNVDSQGMLSVPSKKVFTNAGHQILLRCTNNIMDQIPISYQMRQEALWTNDDGHLPGRKWVNYRQCLVYETKIPPLRRKNSPKRQQYV